MENHKPIIITTIEEARQEGYKDGFSDIAMPKVMKGNLIELCEHYYWQFMKGQADRKKSMRKLTA